MGKPRAAAARLATPPRLRYDSLRPWPSPGIATPPLSHPGSVPFLWEEAPGKPKASSRRSPRRSRCRSLFPPPPAAARYDLDVDAEEQKATAIAVPLPAPPSSPAAVLDGPYHLILPDEVAAYLDGGPSALRAAAATKPSASLSFSGERPASWGVGTGGEGVKRRRKRLVWLFRRSGGGDRHAGAGGGPDGGGELVKVIAPAAKTDSTSFVPGRHSCCGGEVSGGRLRYYIGEVAVDSSGSDGDGGEAVGGGGDDTCSGVVAGVGGGGAGGDREGKVDPNVRLTRWVKEKNVRRSNLFTGATAHLWGSIYGGLKHAAVVVVPWRRSHTAKPAPGGGGGKRGGGNDGLSGGPSRITLQMFLI